MIYFVLFVGVMLLVTGMFFREAARATRTKLGNDAEPANNGAKAALPLGATNHDGTPQQEPVGEVLTGSDDGSLKIQETPIVASPRAWVSSTSGPEPVQASFAELYRYLFSTRSTIHRRYQSRVLSENVYSLLLARSALQRSGSEEEVKSATEDLRLKIEALEIEVNEIKRAGVSMFVPVRSYRRTPTALYADLEDSAMEDSAMDEIIQDRLLGKNHVN